ncbi:MAG: uroporphyrinogen-III synthase [Chloroflexi bacterium]|nr:uroporphyrinogen-III synthase [Chloroflexota bacterium]
MLNTRPREQAGELSRLLRLSGFEPVEVPAIEVISAVDSGDLAKIGQHLQAGDYAWIVFSSANAAKFLDLPLGAAPVLCGTATASSLGVRPAIMLERFSAQAALETLEPLVQPGQRVLIPRAAESRDELTSGLRELGVVVDAPVCYRTVAANIPAWEPVDVITLCSPSAVSALVAAWSAVAVNRSRVVCLGTTTADAAGVADVRVDATARSTSMSALVAAVDSLVGARA